MPQQAQCQLYFTFAHGMILNKSAVIEVLSKLSSPSGKGSLTDSGELKNVQVFGHEVDVDLVLTSPALHIRKKAETDVRSALQTACGPDVKVKVNIEVVVPEKPARKGPESLSGVKHILAIASGKGGVGKSTVTANLALGLVELGFKVGLVDADIYGPSAPMMFDIERSKPGVEQVNGQSRMTPVEAHGVKVMSIGFFADPDQAIVWRGPMATKALNQLFGDVHWGELDYLLVDLPPGTGDIHLTLVGGIPVTGAVVVSTPQPVALADARKGVAMFRLESVNVPVLGIVENMAWFTPEELPSNRYYIFGREGAARLAETLELPLLGQIPLVQSIREAGDVGRPAILQGQTPAAEAFRSLTANVLKAVAQLEMAESTINP